MTRHFVRLLALPWLFGCTGSIGESNHDEVPPPGAQVGSDGTLLDPGSNRPAACQAPGRVVIHRLNHTEYNNTVRDLGFSVRPADSFVEDESLGGFDNNSTALTVSPQLAEQLELASQRLAAVAVSTGIITCKPQTVGETACARQVLAPFARKAWRRPVTAQEIDDLLPFLTLAKSQGDPFEKGIELALQKILQSPNFLYRPELLPDPAATRAQGVDDIALASRLSYFLWSSMPDEALLAAAEAKRLGDPKELAVQIDRMLDDPKVSALTESLAAQWLQGRRAAAAVPDPKIYPKFDSNLRDALQVETALFLGEFFKRNLPLPDLLDADFTFLNGRLAQHYRVAGVSGQAFSRVTDGISPWRGGLLTQANLLLATSSSTESSPPRRGHWVLANLLCTEPPPPPANAAAVQKQIDSATTSPRQRVEARDSRPECGGCHAAFDPIGLGLENYDAVGALRDRYRGGSTPLIDPSGSIPNLGDFKNPKELGQILKKDSRLPACITKVILSYALGRVATAADECVVRQVTESTANGGYSARDVVKALAGSIAFRFQEAQ